MLPLLLAPVLTELAKNGLNILAGAITAKGKEVIEDQIGMKIPDDTVKLTPDLIAALKQKEMEHEEKLIELSIQKQEADLASEKIYLEDTQNARSMQMEALKQEDQFSKRFVYYFAIFLAITTFIYIFCITFGTIPKESVRFADTILGFLLGTLISTLVNFFYGTSRSSKNKDETINQLLSKANNNVNG